MARTFHNVVGLTARDSPEALNRKAGLDIQLGEDEVLRLDAEVGLGVTDGSLNRFVHGLGRRLLDEFKIFESLDWRERPDRRGNEAEFAGAGTDVLLCVLHRV